MSARSVKAGNKEEGTKARWRKRKTVMVGKREESLKYYICSHTLGASNSEFRFHVCLWPGWSNRLNANENEDNESWYNNLLLLAEAIGPFWQKSASSPAVWAVKVETEQSHIYNCAEKTVISAFDPPPRSSESLPITPWASFPGAEWTFTSRMDGLFRREQVFKHLSWPLFMFYTSQHLDNRTKPPEIPAPSPL